MSEKGTYRGGLGVIRDKGFSKKLAGQIKRTERVQEMQRNREARLAAEMVSFQRTKAKLIKRKDS